jgi:hypothetical protein
MGSRNLSSGTFNSPSFCKSRAHPTPPRVKRGICAAIYCETSHLAASLLLRDHWTYCKYPDSPLHTNPCVVSAILRCSQSAWTLPAVSHETLTHRLLVLPQKIRISTGAVQRVSRKLCLSNYLLRIVWNTNSI